MIAKGHVEDLNVGDIVRVKTEVLDKLMRKRNKNEMETKYNTINYTIANYRIMKKIVPNVNNHFYVSRPTYNLNGYDVNDLPTVPVVVRRTNIPQEFFGSDLMKIPVGSSAPSVGGWARSRIINRIH